MSKMGDPSLQKDLFLWNQVCQTVTPLRNGGGRSLVEKAMGDVGNANRHVIQVVPPSREQKKRTVGIEKGERSAQTEKRHIFDRVVYRKITKGHYPIEAQLDLHGFVQEEAYFFLKQFLKSSQKSGLRYVLVITGKGQSHGSRGILCQFVPYWLSTPVFKHYVHAFEQASHRHGGRGALYVQLRR